MKYCMLLLAGMLVSGSCSSKNPSKPHAGTQMPRAAERDSCRTHLAPKLGVVRLAADTLVSLYSPQDTSKVGSLRGFIPDSMLEELSKLRPFSMGADAGSFGFVCLAVTEDHYLIRFNEETGEQVLVKRTPEWEYYSWEQYLTTEIFSVDARHSGQLLRAQPSDSAAAVDPAISPSSHYQAAAVQGEWLEAVWESPEGEPRRGWLRWRYGDCLRVYVFSFA